MKKIKQTTKTPKLRVAREAVRLLAASELDQVGGGMRNNSECGSCCDMGTCKSND
jgi:hypothetical protein